MLLDEREARRIASGRGLLVTGTTGVVEHAASKKLLDLRETLRSLCSTNFRITQTAIDEALARAAQRE